MMILVINKAQREFSLIIKIAHSYSFIKIILAYMINSLAPVCVEWANILIEDLILFYLL